MSNICAIETKAIEALFLPVPFIDKRILYQFQPGMSIQQMLDAIKLPTYCSIIVVLNDTPVHPSEYNTTYPIVGDVVSIRAIPTGGGGGKDVLRIVASIAIMVVAWQVAPMIVGGTWGGMAGLTGLAKVGAMAAFGVMTAVGQLAVNAICPPSTPGLSGSKTYKDSPTYSLTGPSNALNPYGPIPIILGTYRIYPPYAAKPYTINTNNDQYVVCLFNVGAGPIAISDIKLGDTSIGDYDEVELEVIDGYTTQSSTIFPNDVSQDDTSIELTQAGSWQTRTTAANTREIGIDITFPNGLVEISDSGSRKTRSVQCELQVAPTGTSDWVGLLGGSSISAQTLTLPALWQTGGEVTIVLNKVTGIASYINGGVAIPSWATALADVTYTNTNETSIIDMRPADYVSSGYFAVTHSSGLVYDIGAGTIVTDVLYVTGKTTSAVRKTFSFPVTEGQYDVRVKRVTADTTDVQISDKTYWTALRSLQTGSPVTESNIAKIAVKIKATGQLNGAIEDLNCIAQTVCADYDADTSTWITRATNNPASLYRYVLQGAGNKRPLTDAQIDLTKLISWHALCKTNGWTFNHYVDYRTSVDEMLKMIAAAGRASPGYKDGLYSVVVDQTQSVVRQHFTPRNSWGYRYEKTFVSLPHAFRVRFYNEDAGYKEDERIVYDDGYNADGSGGLTAATDFEELSLPGITTSNLAWVHGRYHIATARLRPETHSFNTDFEHLRCTRGDLVRFNHDVIQVGLGYGRVKSTTDDGTYITTITCDEQFTMAAGTTYGLRFRKSDGTSTVVTLITVAGISETVTLSSSLEIADGPTAGDLVMFGVSGSESMELIVNRIEPSNDLTCKLTCLPYSSAIYTADTGEIPLFNTNITTPLNLWDVYVPQISDVRSDESVMRLDISGVYVSRMEIVFVPQQLSGAVDRVQVRYSEANTDNPYHYAESTDLNAIIVEDGVEELETYNIQARYYIQGHWGKWCSAFQETVSGDTNVPDDVANFTIQIIGDVAMLSWDEVDVYDLDHYELRFSSLTTGATWEASMTLGALPSRTDTSAIRATMSGTYLIKAFDRAGRESTNATTIVNDSISLTTMNAAETVTEDPGFDGTCTDTQIYDDTIILTDVDGTWSAPDTMLTTESFHDYGYYAFNTDVDLGDIYVSRVYAVVEATGAYYGDDFFAPTDFFAAADFFGSTAGGNWATTVEMRSTEDDPGGSPTWSSWKALDLTDTRARAFQFRIKLESFEWAVTPVVSALSVTVDMPDRIISGNDVSIDAAGTAISFSPAYHTLTGLGVAIQNGGTGDYYTISSKSTTGFTIQCFNSSATGVARTIDYVATGYGRILT